MTQADAQRRTAPPAPAFYAAAAADFAAVNHLIPRQLTSDVDLVAEIGDYIVSSGGKRLRPLVVLLTARACGVEAPAEPDRDHVRLAAVIEFLHTATLLHDDVVDSSELRRGRQTANALWGNAPSVLVGDFLYSRAFQMMVQIGDLEILRILSDATNVIAEGEVMQLDGIGAVDMDESRYLAVIRSKTAMLFMAASETAAVLAGAPAEGVRAMRDYGCELGLAFQLVDDVLDYSGDTATLGKNVGDDLAEGKMTLPLIETIRSGSPAQADVVRRAVNARCADDFEAVVAAVQQSGAIDYTRGMAVAASERALAHLAWLPESPHRSALEDLARFAVAREY